MTCRSRLTRAFGGRLLILAVCLGGASPALAQREAETLSTSFRKAAEKMLPSVVAVRTVGLVGRGIPYDILGRPVFPGGPGGMPGNPGESDRLPGGSGVVVDAARGLILTSDQAIAGASRVVVVYENGREVETDRVVRDPQTELVVLAVDPRTVHVKEAEWGSSEALQLGDWVLSIGRSSGRAGTVSAGIVSSRVAGAQDDLLRTDAVIGSAGSGGPLIDLEGRIVGINRARLDPRGWPDGFGLAIPAERARRCVSDLAEYGRVRRGYLGLMVAPAGGLELDPTGQAAGLVITGLTVGSPAAEAGLRVGDRIVSVDGQPITNREDFSRAVDEAPIGQEFRLTIERAGKRQDVKVATRQRPQAPFIPAGPFGNSSPGVTPGGQPRNRSAARALRPVPPRPGAPVLRSEGPDDQAPRQPASPAAPAPPPQGSGPEQAPRGEPAPPEPAPALPPLLERETGSPALPDAQPVLPRS
ncbi:MAG TPA: trypsin-like peptidase domain-containing protein [Isosphaeraceae bacterium]|nr:trypsin-like peptidase domain-containing protein [Isosphaeraceae bacterium]